jgi:HK97 gp10 family phage protein
MATVEMSVELDGADELRNALYSLDHAVRTRLVMDAIKSSTRPLKERMKALAPNNDGNLSASIAAEYRSYRNGVTSLAYVGPEWPRGAHGNFAEGGTEQRYTAEGYYRGMVLADPFVQPAFEASQDQIENTLSKELAAGIEREASR